MSQTSILHSPILSTPVLSSSCLTPEPVHLFQEKHQDQPMSSPSPTPLSDSSAEAESEQVFVIKRDGTRQAVDPSKIQKRLTKLKRDVEAFLQRPLHVSVWKISQATISQIYDNITTSELDEEAAEVAAYTSDHPDYTLFAGNILLSNLEADNRDCMSFFEYAKKAFHFVEERTGQESPLISQELFDIAKKFGHLIDKRMVMHRNYLFNYFAMQTLIKGEYLLCAYRTLQKNRMQQRLRVAFETPQHMWMRVALGIHGWNLDKAFELYDLMSQKYGTMATPTLFHSGTPQPSLSSCFLLHMKDDSIAGIYDTQKECALISKHAGGIGLHIHNIRSSGSYIKGNNGTSNGIVPMLRVFNNTARYVNQGGKRKGSFAIYLEPWHPDIVKFLDLKKNEGAEADRARDLFYALWIPDLYYKRLQKAFKMRPEEEQKNPVMWSLMDPNECPGLSDAWGQEFEDLYHKYESQHKYVAQIKIKDLAKAVWTARIETGTPYILHKDHVNRKSNQQNLGTIKSSNLCAEIVEYSSPEETAVCNLASLALPRFVNRQNQTFDYQKLYEVTRVFIRALDTVIDRNFYAVDTARHSNMQHRPIGLGIQGLADVFCHMKIPYGSPESMVVNRRIAETMYFAAVTESHALTLVPDEKGAPRGPYPSIDRNGGAPLRRGVFHFEMWKDDFAKTKNPDGWRPDPELNWDWEGLRHKVVRDGVRNSHLLAQMPTASTAQILGNLESFEPYFGAMFVRKTKAGEFFQYCEPLIEELVHRGLWKLEVDPKTGKSYVALKEQIKKHQGSIQNIDEVPQDLKDMYPMLTDIPLNTLTRMARDRAVFVDQSMSLNVHFKNQKNMMPLLLKYDIMAWKLGLKTGSYYTRTLQDLAVLDFDGLSNKKNIEETECVSCSG